MSKIDVDKLIVYLIENSDIGTYYKLKNALNDQDLEYVNGEIISPLIIEKGKWFVCINKPINKEFPFEKDYLYQSTGYGTIYNGTNFEYKEYECSNYGVKTGHELFRPATEDEIPCEPIFKIGDIIKHKGTNFRGDEIKEIKNYRYYFNDCQSLPFNKQDLWELVERPMYLTEFEYDVRKLMNNCIIDNWKIDEEHIKYASNCLRENIVKHIDVDEMMEEKHAEEDSTRNIYYAYDAYKQGIIDTLNKIWKKKN